MHRTRVGVAVIALSFASACTSVMPVRFDKDATTRFGDDPTIAIELRDDQPFDVVGDSQLVIERRDRQREVFEARVRVRHLGGLLQVEEAFGKKHEYPDSEVRRLSVETPDPVATGVLIGVGSAVLIAIVVLDSIVIINAD